MDKVSQNHNEKQKTKKWEQWWLHIAIIELSLQLNVIPFLVTSQEITNNSIIKLIYHYKINMVDQYEKV